MASLRRLSSSSVFSTISEFAAFSAAAGGSWATEGVDIKHPLIVCDSSQTNEKQKQASATTVRSSRKTTLRGGSCCYSALAGNSCSCKK